MDFLFDEPFFKQHKAAGFDVSTRWKVQIVRLRYTEVGGPVVGWLGVTGEWRR